MSLRITDIGISETIKKACAFIDHNLYIISLRQGVGVDAPNSLMLGASASTVENIIAVFELVSAVAQLAYLVPGLGDVAAAFAVGRGKVDVA